MEMIDLSIVVPTYNCEQHIEPLYESIFNCKDLNIELIFVDDASADQTASIAQSLAEKKRSVHAMQHSENRGAGVARNTGFETTNGEYTLFFDADDRINISAVSEVVQRMKANASDVAMMPYRYERNEANSYSDMNTEDRKIWQRYMAGLSERIGTLNEFPMLLGFSNYPWNKIVNTSHYRNHGLKFGTTQVNNDILGHWWTLLHSKSICLIEKEICTHIVYPDGENLTNRHNRVRLELLKALEDTLRLLESDPILRQRYSHHFWSFAFRVSNWARSRISTEYRDEFNAGLRALFRRIDLEDYGRMATHRAPQLAKQIAEFNIGRKN